MSLGHKFDGPAPISWYPGHMLKAEKEIKKKLSQIDIIIEVIDARAPIITRNYRFNSLLERKRNILVINKTDLIPDAVLKKWVSHFSTENTSTLTLNKDSRTGIKKLFRTLSQESKKLDFHCQVRVMVIGLPNVGKSTIINHLRNKKTAQTGAHPGVTRSQQYIRLDDNMGLVDTPGVMMPRINDLKTTLTLGLLSVVKERLLDKELMVEYLVSVMGEAERLQFMKCYELTEVPENISDLLKKIGEGRGKVMKGGEIDLTASAACILKDFRDGKLGRLCLEWPSA